MIIFQAWQFLHKIINLNNCPKHFFIIIHSQNVQYCVTALRLFDNTRNPTWNVYLLQHLISTHQIPLHSYVATRVFYWDKKAFCTGLILIHHCGELYFSCTFLFFLANLIWSHVKVFIAALERYRTERMFICYEYHEHTLDLHLLLHLKVTLFCSGHIFLFCCICPACPC